VPPPPAAWWRPRGRASHWCALAAGSALLVVLLEALRLPAALLLGAMLAAIALAAAGGSARLPRWPFLAAQAVIGCLMARAITPSILAAILRDWPLLLAMVLAVVAASCVLGWLLARWRVLPGTTAVWGSFPGGASAMVLMADVYGADVRLVAVMHYLRVVVVAIVATGVARLVTSAPTGHAVAAGWLAPVAWPRFAATLAVAFGGAGIAALLRLPSGTLLLPLATGTALGCTGLLRIELPTWLLAATYMVIGWSIGLRFTRPILLHAGRALPAIVASTAVLIATCGGFAVLLSRLAGIDPLTAYLATSPGGADSVAIIATGSPSVDVAFVMALQTTRFVLVLLIGPHVARFIARRTGIADVAG
jgi:membrane AbrB-like protein